MKAFKRLASVLFVLIIVAAVPLITGNDSVLFNVSAENSTPEYVIWQAEKYAAFLILFLFMKMLQWLIQFLIPATVIKIS